MVDQPSGDTPEQMRLRADLLAEYGGVIVAQAVQLSGLTTCLAALGADDLNAEERGRIFHQAATHVQALVDTLMPPAISDKVTECAKRIDSAVDMAILDDIEKRDGLPPARGTLSGGENV